MKILFNDYSSGSQTECYYLSSAINLIQGCSSIIWNSKEKSAYDIFDVFKPDYFVTHSSSIHTDAMHYMSENTNIKLIVNSTGNTKDIVKKIEQILIDENVEVAFFYTNNDEEVTDLKKHNMISIPFGADVFFNDTRNLKYNIDTAFFVSETDQIPCIDNKVYHSISIDKQLLGKADITLPILEISSIYQNYDNIIFKGFERFLPQVFFDTVFYGKNVKYQLDDKNTQSIVEAKIKKLLKVENVEDFQAIKASVKNKHTCLHRAKTLLSQLPSHEFISQLDGLIKNYTGDIT
jgi:hypothetical protein